MKATHNVLIVADDDEEDRMLMRRALEKAGVQAQVITVEDGDELLRYLRKQGAFAGSPTPDLILLDLNMPRKDGRTALKEIRDDPALRTIPVVAVTTSSNEEDVRRMYELGVNAYVRKPTEFKRLVEIAHALERHWFGTVLLPGAALLE